MNKEKTSFQETLKLIYQGQDKIAQLIEGLDEIPEQSLKDYYIKLQMVLRPDDEKKGGYESISGEKKEITLNDLFEKLPDVLMDEPPQKILILGGAGVGKSTLLQYIAYKWGSGDLWQEKFAYVYRISLKTMLNPHWKSSPWQYEADELNDNLLRCLVHYSATLSLSFKEKRNISTKSIPWIGETEKELLLILDGYDEVAHLKDKADFKRIFEEIFEFKNVILTSRPNALTNDMRANFDCVVENTGLDSKGIEEYFERYFQKDKNKKEELLKFLDTQSFIKDICKIPVNIAMLSYIWQYSESSEHLQQISNVSSLYQQILSHLGYRYLQKKLENTNSSKLGELKELIYNGELTLDELKVINYTGYKAITGGGINIDDTARVETLIIQGASYKDGKVDLADKDGISIQSSINYLASISEIKNTPEHKVTIKQLFKYGILKTEATASTLSSAKTLSETDMQKLNFGFIHLTFQEYCTANYLKDRLQRGNEEERRNICRFLAEHRNEPRYLMTLKFMAGIIMSDKSKENDLVIKIFWDSMICNVDGVVEFGIETKAVLIIHLLGQICEKVESLPQVDPRISNIKEIVDFIDAVALKDLSRFYNDLVDSNYMSENIIEGILEGLTYDDKEDWHLKKMNELAERSQGSLKASIHIMMKAKKAQLRRERDKPKTMIHQKLIRAIEIALSFTNIGKSREYNEEYGLRIIRNLRTIFFENCKKEEKEDLKLIQAIVHGISTVLVKAELFVRFTFEELFECLGGAEKRSFFKTLIPKIENNSPVLKDLINYSFKKSFVDEIIYKDYLASKDTPKKKLVNEIFEYLFSLPDEEFTRTRIEGLISSCLDYCKEIVFEKLEVIVNTYLTSELDLAQKQMFFRLMRHLFEWEKIVDRVPERLKIQVIDKLASEISSSDTELVEQSLLVVQRILSSIKIENEEIALKILKPLMVIFANHSLKSNWDHEILSLKEDFSLQILQLTTNFDIELLYRTGYIINPNSNRKEQIRIASEQNDYVKLQCQIRAKIKACDILNDQKLTNDTDVNAFFDQFLMELRRHVEFPRSLKRIISLNRTSIATLCARGMLHVSRDRDIARQSLKGVISLLKQDRESTRIQAIDVAEKIYEIIRDKESDRYAVKNILPLLSKKNDDLRRFAIIAVGRLVGRTGDQSLILLSVEEIILSLDYDRNEYRKEDIFGKVGKVCENLFIVAKNAIIEICNWIENKEIIIKEIVNLLTDHYSNKSQVVRLLVLAIVDYVIKNKKLDQELASLISQKLTPLFKEMDPEMFSKLNFQISKVLDVLEDKEVALQMLKHFIPLLSPKLDIDLLAVPLNKMIKFVNDKELADQLMPKMLEFFEVTDISQTERFKLEAEFLNAIFSVTKDKESIVKVVNDHFNDYLKLLSEENFLGEDECVLTMQLFEFIEDKNMMIRIMKDSVSHLFLLENYEERRTYLSDSLILIAKSSEGEKLLPQIFEIISQVKNKDIMKCFTFKKLLKVTKNEELIAQTLQTHIESIGFLFVRKCRKLIVKRNDLLIQSINQMFLLFKVPDYKDVEEVKIWSRVEEIEVLAYLTCKAIGIFGTTNLTLKSINIIENQLKKRISEWEFNNLAKKSSIIEFFATTSFLKKDFSEYRNLSPESESLLNDHLAGVFIKLQDKFKLLREALKSKHNLNAEVLNKQLFDNKLDEIVKQKILVQISILNQDKSDQSLEALKNSLVAEINCIFDTKAHEIIEKALQLIGYEDRSTSNSSKKKVADAAKEVLELQLQHLNEEGMEWLTMNLESLMKLSGESKPFFKKVFHKILRDFEITSIEEGLIIRLIIYGFTTSMTRMGDLIFEGKKYPVKTKNIEGLFERISQNIINLKRDALAPQYRRHMPIFNKSIELGLKTAACDIEEVFSLFERSFELSSEKWLLTKLTSEDQSQSKLIMEQRNTLGDHVVYDITKQNLIKVNPEDIDEKLEELFGPFNPSYPIKYRGQSKELESNDGYKIISNSEAKSSLKFEEIPGSEPSEETTYFQQKLLKKGDDDNYAWLSSQLDQKVDDGDKTLSNLINSLTFLDQLQKQKLTDYYKAFLRTFTDVYTTAQVIESGQVVVDAGSTSSIGLLSTMITFIPVIGDKLASGLDSMDKFMKNQEMVNSAKKMKSFASSHVEIYQLASNCAIDILKNQAKQSEIIAAVELGDEGFDLLDGSLSDKLSNTLKTELAKMMGTKIYGEVYSTPASKLGNRDAKKLIQGWIMEPQNDGAAERSKEDIKKQLVNEITQKDKEDDGAKSETPCLQKAGCNMF